MFDSALEPSYNLSRKSFITAMDTEIDRRYGKRFNPLFLLKSALLKKYLISFNKNQHCFIIRKKECRESCRFYISLLNLAFKHRIETLHSIQFSNKKK